MTLQPLYRGRMEPVYACREMFTRHCPAAYDAVCGDRPCARYESEDPAPWLPEIGPGEGETYTEVGEQS